MANCKEYCSAIRKKKRTKNSVPVSECSESNSIHNDSRKRAASEAAQSLWTPESFSSHPIQRLAEQEGVTFSLLLKLETMWFGLTFWTVYTYQHLIVPPFPKFSVVCNILGKRVISTWSWGCETNNLAFSATSASSTASRTTFTRTSWFFRGYYSVIISIWQYLMQRISDFKTF